MESQPQNAEFRINPENFHPCISIILPLLPTHTTFLVVNFSPAESANSLMNTS